MSLDSVVDGNAYLTNSVICCRGSNSLMLVTLSLLIKSNQWEQCLASSVKSLSSQKTKWLALYLQVKGDDIIPHPIILGRSTIWHFSSSSNLKVQWYYGPTIKKYSVLMHMCKHSLCCCVFDSTLQSMWFVLKITSTRSLLYKSLVYTGE